MSAASPKWNPPTFEVLPSAISSPALEFGLTPCDSPVSPMTKNGGAEAAPAQVSAQQVKASGLQTLVTSGRTGIASSASVALEESLVSKLQQRLDMAGSTLFVETWKRRDTPLRRRYWEHTASVRRTSDKGCTSVPTPNTPSGGPNSKSTATHTGGMDLEGAVSMAMMPHVDAGTGIHGTGSMECCPESDAPTLASVPTPMSGSPATETYNAAGNNDYSRKIVELASVCSPTSQDCSRGGKPARPWDTGVPLTQQVALATIPTPNATDGSKAPEKFAGGNLSFPATAKLFAPGVDPDGSIRSRLDQLPQQAQLADSGPTATGGTPATKSTGQLNPDYSRWLMGLPAVFSNCADSVTRSARRSQPSSSEVSAKQVSEVGRS